MLNMGSIFGEPTKEIGLMANVIISKSLNHRKSQLPVNQIKPLPSPYLNHNLFYVHRLGCQVRVV